MKTTKLLALGLAAVVTVTTTSAMAADGEKLFNRKCKSCHSLEAGKDKTGPSLHGVYGRQAGSTDSKKYKALKGADFAWDDEHLHGWLENPKKFIGKSTPMTAKIKKEKDRAAIIEFLKTQK